MPTTGGRTADFRAKRRTAAQQQRAEQQKNSPRKRKSSPQKDLTRYPRSRSRRMGW